MKKFLIFLVFIPGCAEVYAGPYTEQKFKMHACKAFAIDARLASVHFMNRTPYSKLKLLIHEAKVAPVTKDRMHEAVDYVYFNNLDVPYVAYSVALSNCLEPKTAMAPMEEPYAVSPRTLGSFF